MVDDMGQEFQSMKALYQVMLEEDEKRKGLKPKSPEVRLRIENDQREKRAEFMRMWDRLYEQVLEGKLKPNDEMVRLAMNMLEVIDKKILHDGNQHIWHGE